MTPIEYFKELCKIPHGSGNEQGIAKYIEGVAKAHGLYCFTDQQNNVYVRRAATAGYEDRSPILFASHTDMVCEKLPSSDHDFLTDEIKVIEKNGKLYAYGTTLGGDDGAGVAIMLSLMTDPDLIAPVTEYLFTSAEETGMYGAIGFDYSNTLSEKVINLDTGWENGVCISCASGYRYDIKIPLNRTRNCGKAAKITVSGLCGGHSGVEIDTQRQNAVKLLGVVLDKLYSEYPLHLVSVECDGKANVIAPSASATLFFYNDADEKHAKDTVLHLEKEIRSHLIKSDAKKFRIEYKKLNTESVSNLTDMMTLKSSSTVISALVLAPQGVLARFEKDGSPKSSVNIGIVKTDKQSVTVSFLARAASSYFDEVTHGALLRLAHVLGASLTTDSFHGCWEYKLGTYLQSQYEKAYAEVFNGKPEFFATHAGLECGTFYEKLSALGRSPDIISVGPNMHDIHTPKESLDIESVDRIYNVTRKLLKIICE